MTQDLAREVIGDYIKCYDETWVRKRSIDLISVYPIDGQWIVTINVNKTLISFSTHHTKEEAKLALDDLLNLLRN